jgi:putative glycosyltransferase (TIGR04372 family)
MVSVRKTFALRVKEAYWTATRALGLSFVQGNERKYAIHIVGIVLFPIYWLIAKRLSRTRVRFLDAIFEGEPYGILEHVGQCAMDFDSYLKDQILIDRKVLPIFPCAGRKPANPALMTHWSRFIIFIRNPWLDFFIQPLMSYPEIVDHVAPYGAVRRGATRNFEVQTRWGERPPLLMMSEADVARGEAQLRRMGIPQGAWFVCVHSREGGYIPGAEWQHAFRNSKIADYVEAMQAIVARGGWCVRVGDASMQPLDPMPNVIDYALSPSKSDWMDLYLCAQCRFFLGNTSGLFGVAGIFGRPSALANMTPLGCAYGPFPQMIAIQKLLTDSQGRLLSFPDILASEASQFNTTPEFVENRLSHIDNTPAEIAEVAIEMMDRLDGRLVYQPEEDALQERFRALIQPCHLSWPGPGRIGRLFLSRNQALLDSSGRTDFASKVVLERRA